MKNDYFGEYISAIAEYPDCNFLNPGASEELIEAFEARHNISLPRRYREFLMINNGGELFRFSTGTVLGELSVGQKYKTGVPYLEYNFEKGKKPEELPSGLFVIADCADGSLICLDLRSSDGTDCRTVFWDMETGEAELEWETIKEWLSDEIQGGIENMDN